MGHETKTSGCDPRCPGLPGAVRDGVRGRSGRRQRGYQHRDAAHYLSGGRLRDHGRDAEAAGPGRRHGGLGGIRPAPGRGAAGGEPASARHSLDSVGGYLSAYQVRATSWWLAPGHAAALIAWETARLPRKFTPSSSTSSGGRGAISVTGQFYELAAGPSALTGQYLIVSVADLGGGKTAIRVDAEVGYQPTRPAGEKVPATARVVTITAVSGYAGSTAPHPATITRASVVRTLTALVNGLQLSTAPPDAPCPMTPGLILELTFRATAGGRPLAVAQGPAGCGTLALTVAGKEWPPLGLTGPFSTRVLGIAGLHWSSMR